MKNTTLAATVHILAISTFVYLAAAGMTAQATMMGAMILIVWAVASMLVLELRGLVLETEMTDRPASRRNGARSGATLVRMPVQVRTAA